MDGCQQKQRYSRQPNGDQHKWRKIGESTKNTNIGAAG